MIVITITLRTTIIEDSNESATTRRRTRQAARIEPTDHDPDLIRRRLIIRDATTDDDSILKR